MNEQLFNDGFVFQHHTILFTSSLQGFYKLRDESLIWPQPWPHNLQSATALNFIITIVIMTLGKSLFGDWPSNRNGLIRLFLPETHGEGKRGRRGLVFTLYYIHPGLHI